MLSAILQDWADFFLRWLHVVAAVFWVGLALGFLRLNLQIKSSKSAVSRAADDGFFVIARSMTVAEGLEPQIGWFRWEAYVVWLSGAALLVLRYFWQADLYLIDPSRAQLAPWQAVGIALVALTIGWLAYDFLCKRAWSEPVRRAAVFVLLAVTAFALAQVYSGRGALIVFGAVIGTIMAANVAHYVVPNQRRMLAAVRAGEQPDEARFAMSRQRALHNNYLALPVLFLMLSVHYPLAHASRYNWIVALLALVCGAAIRHFFVARHRGEGSLWWTWGLAAASAVAMIALSWAGARTDYARAPSDDAIGAIASVTAPRFADVADVVATRCALCHARVPTWEGLAGAPQGVRLDTYAAIRAHVQDIARNAIWTNSMPPPGAHVGMTENERAVLAAWIRAGAPGN